MKLFNAKNQNKPQDLAQNVGAQRRFILNKKSNFFIQEAYKTLRTNVRFFLSGDGCKKFCVTSSDAGEGKSITILNLAISFAQTDQKVLLIDADLRRPTLARLLVENATPGLSNVLAGLCQEEEAIRKEVYPNLDIMYSGEIPPNPSELLGSERMRNMMDRLAGGYDYILVDTPPVGIVSDTCIVGNLVDGVLFVVRQNRAEKEAVAHSVRQLEMSGVKLMGFVMNGAEENGTKKRKYKYKYSYEFKPRRW